MIEFEGVTKVFPGGTVAVDDLSLVAPTGRITVVVGPAGCGKTTLLRMVNRLVDPSAGRVLLDGVPNTSSRRSQLRRGIGYVMQQGGLFPHRTVVENIETVPVLTGVKRRTARVTAYALLERVGLSETFAERYPGQLSMGQQLRVALARALAADPPILLMDEPFSALDPVVRVDLQDDLLDLQQAAPKTILFVTHDIDEAIKLGDQIAVLDAEGRLVQLATPESLLVSPGSDFVADFLGRDRGIRKLSFLPAGELPLARVGTVQAGATGLRAKAIADAQGDRWLLVLDPERLPRGWVDTTTLPPDAIVSGPVVHPLGGTYYADESVLAAMDAAILSPPGLAVCISDDGHALGVVSHSEIAWYLAARRPDPPEPAAYPAPPEPVAAQAGDAERPDGPPLPAEAETTEFRIAAPAPAPTDTRASRRAARSAAADARAAAADARAFPEPAPAPDPALEREREPAPAARAPAPAAAPAPGPAPTPMPTRSAPAPAPAPSDAPADAPRPKPAQSAPPVPIVKAAAPVTPPVVVSGPRAQRIAPPAVADPESDRGALAEPLAHPPAEPKPAQDAAPERAAGAPEPAAPPPAAPPPARPDPTAEAPETGERAIDSGRWEWHAESGEWVRVPDEDDPDEDDPDAERGAEHGAEHGAGHAPGEQRPGGRP